MKDKKTVLIFGAGASYDIDPGVIGMPLSKNLYRSQVEDDLVSQALRAWPNLWRYSSSMNKLIDSEKYQGDVEKYLADLWRSAHGTTRVALEPRDIVVSSFFYLLWMCSLFEQEGWANKPNNYSRLFGVLNSPSPPFHISDVISFNYDTVLDHDFRDRYNVQNSVQAYLDKRWGRPRLIKPHGSANWYVICPVTDKLKVLISDQGDVNEKVRTLSTVLLDVGWELEDVRITNTARDVQDKLETNYGESADNVQRPVMILPLVDKSATIDEGFKPISQAMQDAINQADQVILIGYQGKDNDFRQVLRDRKSSHPLTISVVGTRRSAKSIQDKLIALDPDNFKPGFIFYDREEKNSGFSEFVSALEYGRFVIADGEIVSMIN